jgi:hypothetical protein
MDGAVLTRDNAHAVMLCGAPAIAPISTPTIVCVCAFPKWVRDLPSGGRRLMQRAEGYVATIVAGQPVCGLGQQN